MPTLPYAPPSTPTQRRRLALYRPLPFLFLWLTFVLGSSWPLYLAAAVSLAYLAYRRHFPTILLSVIFSPFTFVIAQGFSDYATGTARLKHVGTLLVLENVDPASRLRSENTGDVSLGNELLFYGLHNFAASLAARTFGPMRGSYTGPYPDQRAATAAIDAAPPLNLAGFYETDDIPIGRGTLSLNAGEAAALLRGFREGPATDPQDATLVRTYGPAKAAILSTSVLILSIPAAPLDPPRIPDNRVLILIDLATDRPFAVYSALHPIPYRRTIGW